MLIKQADDRTQDIEVLQRLLSHPAANVETKRKIDQEIRKISSGAKGERDAAYEINFHFGASSKNWAVIHDLRIEHGGRVAQIDHILINRFLDVWVCESKRFSDGIAINDQGECTTFWQKKPQGISSPYEQNSKHIAVLKALCDSGTVELPTRLGFTIKPSFNGLVVVSTNARITRPKVKGWWDEDIVKADQVGAKIKKTFESENNPLLAARIVSAETVESVARRLARLHVPLDYDWYARFGLSEAVIQQTATQPAAEAVVTAVTEAEPKKTRLTCVSCSKAVTYNVAKFCWVNKARFGGNVYCMECQNQVAKACVMA